jgi:hypothetical protein
MVLVKIDQAVLGRWSGKALLLDDHAGDRGQGRDRSQGLGGFLVTGHLLEFLGRRNRLGRFGRMSGATAVTRIAAIAAVEQAMQLAFQATAPAAAVVAGIAATAAVVVTMAAEPMMSRVAATVLMTMAAEPMMSRVAATVFMAAVPAVEPATQFLAESMAAITIAIAATTWCSGMGRRRRWRCGLGRWSRIGAREPGRR